MYTDIHPTSVTAHNNSVAIILTVFIGLFVIVIILVVVAVGFGIHYVYGKSKWYVL